MKQIMSNELPALEGSAKQIAWAQDIIDKAIRYCDEKIAYCDKWSVNDDCKVYGKIWRLVRAWAVTNFETMDSAARIIDSRSHFSNNVLDTNAYKIFGPLSNGDTLTQIAERSGIKNYKEA